MRYIVQSSKSVKEVAKSLQAGIIANGFGILYTHNLEEALQEKGIELGEACCIFEICNPKLAKEVLSRDMSMNMLLPCRISVYTDQGITHIGMIKPSTLMHDSEHSQELLLIADIIEAMAKEIIDNSQ